MQSFTYTIIFIHLIFKNTEKSRYAFLDFGTNYCNLRNLIDAQG